MTVAKYIPNNFKVKPCSKKELQVALGVSKYVLNTWLKNIEEDLGPPISGLYSVKQVQFIIEKFGLPGYLIREAG